MQLLPSVACRQGRSHLAAYGVSQDDIGGIILGRSVLVYAILGTCIRPEAIMHNVERPVAVRKLPDRVSKLGREAQERGPNRILLCPALFSALN